MRTEHNLFLSGCTYRFVSDYFGYTENRDRHGAAHFILPGQEEKRNNSAEMHCFIISLLIYLIASA